MAKSIAKLATGRAVAIVVTLASVPLIARLYDEDSIGVFTIITAITMCLQPMCWGMCYCQAMPLAKTIAQRRDLFALSLVIGTLFTILVTAIVLLAGTPIVQAFGHPQLADYLFYLPILCLGMAIGGATTMALNCEKQFGRVALRVSLQGILRRAVQVGAGLLSLAQPAGGLLIGNAVGSYANGLFLSVAPVKALWRRSNEPFRLAGLGAVAREYRAFPLYRIWSATLVPLTDNFVILFLGFFFPLSVLAYYGMDSGTADSSHSPLLRDKRRSILRRGRAEREDGQRGSRRRLRGPRPVNHADRVPADRGFRAWPHVVRDHTRLEVARGRHLRPNSRALDCGLLRRPAAGVHV